MIKVACSGFPVGRKKYEEHLRTVELDQLFDKFPKESTVQKWIDNAPPNFDFIVCASKIITHAAKSRAQHGRKSSALSAPLEDNAPVRHAYATTLRVAETLRSRLVLFQLPPQFAPSPDNIQRIQRFFAQRRGHILFVWEPPVTWPNKLVDTLSEAYRIFPVMNPLGPAKPTPNSPLRYYRLGANGRTSGAARVSEADMRTVKKLCDTPLSYVIFNNGPTAFEDAIRFNTL